MMPWPSAEGDDIHPQARCTRRGTRARASGGPNGADVGTREEHRRCVEDMGSACPNSRRIDMVEDGGCGWRPGEQRHVTL